MLDTLSLCVIAFFMLLIPAGILIDWHISICIETKKRHKRWDKEFTEEIWQQVRNGELTKEQAIEILNYKPFYIPISKAPFRHDNDFDYH